MDGPIVNTKKSMTLEKPLQNNIEPITKMAENPAQYGRETITKILETPLQYGRH